ncbi:TonB-dependent receptor [Flavisolibacter ginsenosidimutans]|uniref:TonB-dependent receptor n=2 Tax=Flavisolibacter ginsenosidimutans TaxID=661481 RepID=A0A5B8UPC8_9BACT|nr:TonB-dependent receptor [Flavisolibacter ginsenosidimutans]
MGFKLKIIFLFFLFALFTALACFAQQRTVTGRVTSADNQPLAGISVTVKGTTTGTSTDANGNFSINAATGSTLVFSGVGVNIQEATVGAGNTVNATLQSNAAALNEVVVIGYQTVRRKDLTGATGVVNMNNVSRITSQSVGEAIQGTVPGVTVRNGGAPGANSTIEIRGVSNFSSTSPLYVIDGMLADANTTINPDDVATIQVLKDASAAAIYGSRAGNGVIIITTKKGREGPSRVTFSARYGIQQLPKKWNVMDAPQYLKTVQQEFQNSGVTLPTGIAAQLTNNTINTNWQNEVYRTGAVQDYNVGLSGGSQTANILVSAGYYKNKGILIANDFERASFRINSEARKGRITFGENMVLSNSNGKNPGGGLNAFYEAPLSLPIVAVKGSQYAGIPANPGAWGMGTSDVPSYASNYIANAALDRQTYNFAKLLGNAYVDVRIVNGLTYRFNAGAEVSFDTYKEIRDTGIWRYANQPPNTSINESRQRFTNLLLEHTLNFNRNFGRHAISAVVGFSRTEQKREVTSGGRVNLVNANGTLFTTIGSATGALSAAGGTPVFWRSHGYLGRINYTYDDRYLLTLTGRIDQDSRFGPNFQTGRFPSVAAAWRINREKFFHVNWINDLKLRASYGKLGFSDVLGSWDYFSVINVFPRAVYGISQGVFAGAYQSQLTNPDLRWEERTQKNAGFDANVLNNRLTVSFDVYNALSKDLLVFLTPPPYLGFSGTVATNTASMRNTGVEFSATYRSRPTSSSPWRWDVSANFTTIKNRVLGVGERGKDASGNAVDYIESTNFIRAQVGHSIGEWYVIKTAGIFKSQQEIDSYVSKSGQKVQPNAKPGDVRYVDANGDGQINNNDRQYAGSPWPNLQTGAQFNASYKQFSFNLQLVGVFGNKIYNDIRRNLDAYQVNNFRKDINPWSPANPNGTDPRLAVDQASDPTVSFNNMAQTDRWLESGSYLRIRNVEIAFALPKTFLNRFNFSSARVYVSGQNIATFTKYKGLDPDVQGTGVISRGFDAGNWPSSRILSFGIQADF